MGRRIVRKGMRRRVKDRCMVFIRICDKDQQGSILAYPEKELTEEEKIQYEECIKRRAERIPLQHITGYRNLWDFRFW